MFAEYPLNTSLQGKAIQERKIARQDGKTSGQNQRANYDQQHPADNFHRVQVAAETAVKSEKTIDTERGQQERHCEARGINGEQRHALGDGFLGSGKSQDAGKDWADARCPTEREGEADEKCA